MSVIGSNVLAGASGAAGGPEVYFAAAGTWYLAPNLRKIQVHLWEDGFGGAFQSLLHHLLVNAKAWLSTLTMMRLLFVA